MNSDMRIARRPLVLALLLALGSGDASAATITVMDGTDDPSSLDCTLRQALASADYDTSSGGCTSGTGPDTIVFDGSLQNATIALAQGELLIHSAVDIQGTGQTIDAGGQSRVINANLYASSLSLSNVTLTLGNAGTHGGGGINLYTAPVTAHQPSEAPVIGATLDRVTVSNNMGGMLAAGIAASVPIDLTLRHCTISGNVAGTPSEHVAGGVYMPVGSVLYVTDSTISGNTATATLAYASGGIYSRGSVLLTNSTVAGNTAFAYIYMAGGLWAGSASSLVVLQDSTITGNVVSNGGPSATVSGAGGVVFVAGGSAYAANTIISDNVVYSPPNLRGPAANSDVAYSDLRVFSGGGPALRSCLLGSALEGGFSGNGNVFSDAPGLMPLADNGGPTRTMALAETSPALNGGDPSEANFIHAGIVTGLHFDQRGFGFPRMRDGNVDIGAYQHQGDRIFADGHEAEP